MTSEPRLSLLEFPCRFPIKAMGRHGADFERAVREIVLAHARLVSGEGFRVTPSKAGNFVSVTAVIEAESQQQLDTIYQSLSDCELVLMAL
jgi:putative lipoic acid-binding regulatory protein